MPGSMYVEFIISPIALTVPLISKNFCIKSKRIKKLSSKVIWFPSYGLSTNPLSCLFKLSIVFHHILANTRFDFLQRFFKILSCDYQFIEELFTFLLQFLLWHALNNPPQRV
ncbi:111aa long hypothetical protein [Pyrococcus horikoshii OT3]|uniref:Uncharacterized protein n=1 Tax=Pyrococcus horikoshii (strain ATCC 700860 / DSM 12428 / JCM 9974 / NBRC 100139 / OT-3) TaxID=70601 RepID=O58421_PYRHO|nr:111aa long hypothetical protein [Pyrococcus horikoshii OT3]